MIDAEARRELEELVESWRQRVGFLMDESRVQRRKGFTVTSMEIQGQANGADECANELNAWLARHSEREAAEYRVCGQTDEQGRACSRPGGHTGSCGWWVP